MAPVAETRMRVTVDGGDLVGALWNAEAPGTPVVGIHGITANHRSFVTLAERLGRPLLAMDVRGRGRSRELGAPYGMRRHAADVRAAMDAAGFDRVVLAGHSMGAFVATRLAQAHPDRVAGTVLIDGGLPLRPPPPGTTPEQILGPAIARLSMTFTGPQAYREFMRQHPALGPYWGPTIDEYVDYDLAEIDGALRPAAVPDAVVADLMELGGSPDYLQALEGVTSPRVLVWSPRGLLDETPGLYDADWRAQWAQRLPGLRLLEAPDTNHYTVLLGDGVDVVAAAVAEIG